MDFIDLSTQQKIIKEKIEKRISDVLNHGQYIMGPEVFELEKKLRSFRHHIEYDHNPLGQKKIEELIKQKRLIYNYKADQRTKNKFLNNEILEELEENRLPEYIKFNKLRLKEWFYE